MKQLWDFAAKQAPEESRVIMVKAAISGVASAALLGIVNHAATKATQSGALRFSDLLIYVVGFVAYVWAARGSLLKANALIERVIREQRTRIADKIRKAELPVIERLGRGELYVKVNQDTHLISLTYPMLVDVCQDIVMFVCCVFYIAYLSPLALLLMGLASMIGGWWFKRAQGEFVTAYLTMFHGEAELMEQMGHVVRGFTELKMSSAKGHALLERVRQTTEDLRQASRRVGGHQAALSLFGTSFVYGLLATITYILPLYVQVLGQTSFKLSAAFLFCIGPLMGAVSMAPMMWRAESGLLRLRDLERQLDEGATARPDNLEQIKHEFRSLSVVSFQGLTYRYPGVDESFELGPVSFDVRAGESLFVVGGNGSGKSTLLKLLCGLYQPTSGEILVDGRALGPGRRYALRESFATVFTDYHLFDCFYGLEGIEADRVNALLDEVRLSHKVMFRDGRFSTLKLSTGQRKRLALVASLIEDKKLYIFDEWTADQDQQFRQQFYHEIIPRLKADGKAVIVVSHDDRYWATADSLIKLDRGQIVEMTSRESQAE